MVRELGEAVSCTLLLDDNTLLVGGWDGRIKYWSDEGDVLWEAQTPNRISSMVVQDECIYATSGLHLVCLKQDSGEQVWDMALEGSADAVVSTATCILAVSSVYDIEHNDFIESAIWAISFEGELLQTHRMAERPWTLQPYNDGAIAGLGRPMNGYLVLDENGNIIEQNKDWESPTICSTNGENPVFGLADGSIRSMDGTLVSAMQSAISNVIKHANGHVVADDNGNIEFVDDDVQWKANGNEVVALSLGFDINEKGSCWVARWNGSQGEINVHSIDDGQHVASLNGQRVHDMAFNGQRIAAGCENGQVFVWEEGLFQRRIEMPDQQQNDPLRSAMFEKLRALRK
ncbi:MAG: PQQ-binding-like beta-propeller repeat protein [Candidatus Thermoplasmatota archaeon]|nr:PQQ-binding-like beta-propeller repeat protein [Candidatus Thermoplasmatota archaeon]